MHPATPLYTDFAHGRVIRKADLDATMATLTREQLASLSLQAVGLLAKDVADEKQLKPENIDHQRTQFALSQDNCIVKIFTKKGQEHSGTFPQKEYFSKIAKIMFTPPDMAPGAAPQEEPKKPEPEPTEGTCELCNQVQPAAALTRCRLCGRTVCGTPGSACTLGGRVCKLCGSK